MKNFLGNFFKKNKIGIWYKIFKSINTEIGDKKIKILFFKNIYKLGYRYFSLKKRSKTDIYLIKAFQRRFNPNNVTGILDKKTYIISHFLAI